EADHYAFDILRSETNDYTAAYYLDTEFAEGDPSGAEYEYEDWSAEYGVMYYYWLESYASRDDFEPQDVFGPVQARAGIELPKAVFLPHVMGHRTLPPTPTPLPYPVPVEFSNREDLPIPDTGEPQTSTITVPDVFAGLMSHVQVFVNIFHPDAGDLQVVLVSPQGTRFMLHRRFEYDGTRNLRREFWIQYGLFGLPFHGTWALEVTDRVESAPSREPTPVLAQWELTIFALPTPAPTPTASP
ncbi:MAG TPA: proprotein convertase P-domain-containing protein, partial [Ardenticatenaceae bacterium]|nr:proprotein convertase P-domain-containing protein [Ardenticatenaceae bacterium]